MQKRHTGILPTGLTVYWEVRTFAMLGPVSSVTTMHQVHERAREQQEKRERPQDMTRVRPQQPAAEGRQRQANHETSRRSEKSPNSHVFLLQTSIAFAALHTAPLADQPTLTSVIIPVAM